MRKLFVFLLVISSTFANAWIQRAPNLIESCKIHAPYGFPITNGITTICRQGYLVGYDAAAKLPKFVTYQLTPNNALGCIARTDAFAIDKSIINGATPDDYVGTGYDKGHMSPDGDLSWDVQVEYESFLMTNMSPQAGSFNRGIWKLLETSIRGWTVQNNQPYTIYVGSVYNATDKTIGNGVRVPHAYYKIVINNKTNKVAGWMFPHTPPYPNLGNDLTKFRLAILDIEKIAKVDFKFPNNSIELQPGQEWPINFGQLTDSKRNKCR